MNRTILFVFAHPDDESFIGAGTAARYREEGVRVVLAVATRGQRGKAGDPPICSREDLPRVREAEGRRAAAIIGFDEVHFLDHEDQQLASAPIEQIRRELVGLVRRYRPAIVVTFDPDGLNRHADHVAIGRFVSDAVAAAADARWFPETGAAHQVPRLLWTPPVPPWEFAAPDLRTRPGVDFVVDVSRWWRTKREALAAHRTQHLSITRLFFGREDLEAILSVEAFRQAWGPRIGPTPADDLFVGLD